MNTVANENQLKTVAAAYNEYDRQMKVIEKKLNDLLDEAMAITQSSKKSDARTKIKKLLK